MDTRLVLVPLIIFVAASVLMALPGTRSRGCLAYLVRLVGFMVGALSPLIILWQIMSSGGSPLGWRFPGALLTYLVIIACIVLGGCAVTLVAAGWQILLRRGRGDFEEKIDLSWFGLPDFGSPMTSNLSLESCFGIAAFVLLGGLFWLGLILGSAMKDSLVLRVKGPGRRAIQNSGELCGRACALWAGHWFSFVRHPRFDRCRRLVRRLMSSSRFRLPARPIDTKYALWQPNCPASEVWKLGIRKIA